MNPQVVVFDLDDTLYLEEGFVRSGFAAVAARCAAVTGEEPGTIAAELWDAFRSGVRGDAFDRLVASRPMVKEAVSVADLVEAYRHHEPSITPAGGIPELLSELAGRGIRLAVITDGDPGIQSRKLAALGIAGWFGLVVATGMWGRDRWKPHPQGFATVEAWSGRSPGQHVYVGDNPSKDFRAPRARGWVTVRMILPRQLHEATSPAAAEDGPDVEVRSVAELRDTLLGPRTPRRDPARPR